MVNKIYIKLKAHVNKFIDILILCLYKFIKMLYIY